MLAGEREKEGSREDGPPRAQLRRFPCYMDGHLRGRENTPLFLSTVRTVVTASKRKEPSGHRLSLCAILMPGNESVGSHWGLALWGEVPNFEKRYVW